MRVITKEDFEKLMTIENADGKMTCLEISEVLDVSKRYAEVYRTLLDNQENLGLIFGDQDLIGANVKLAKSNLKFQDMNRIERKAFREYARMDNALVALNEAVLAKFDEIDFNIPLVVEGVEIVEGDQAIIQLSDTHFNELVDLDDNTYDFEVASKRMALFAAEAKRILGAFGVKKIILAMTGDLINSDRRLDEKLNLATNRMTAAMIATNLIQYFIQDLMTGI